MPGIQDIPGDQFVWTFYAAQATAGNTDAWNVFVAPSTVAITGVSIVPNAAVTGANTNNFALQAINKGQAGAGTTGVTAVKTYASGTNSVAFDEEALTLSTTSTDLNLAAGDVLALVRTINGSGLASPAGLVQVKFRFR